MNQNTTLNQTRRTGKLLNFLVLFCLIFSTVVSTPVAQAQAPQPTPTNTDTPTVSPPQTETTTPISETVTPSVVTTPAPVTPTETPIPVATLMPVVNDQAAVPALVLSTKPEFITPGGNLKLDWVIEGLTVVEGQFVLEITFPDGVSVKKTKDSEYDPTTRVLTIAVTVANGQVHLDTGAISGDMLVTAALLENKEIIAEAKLLVPMREQFKQDQTGGVIEARNGGIKVEFPTDALPEEATITIGKPAREALPNGALLGVPFEITAYGDMSKQELKKFSKELTLTVSYADLGIPPEREGDLHVYWYNETTKEWEALPTWVDKKTKTLQALTDHFTVFDLNVSNWQSNHLPTVDAFQVSGFTGAGTYSLPIQLPAGPGGFQPSLALTYNSQVVDQSTLNTQASWVGMGWSLDSSYIELDTHGTGSWDLDDTYLLQVGGISTRIVLDGAGTYRATDENFWKITKASNSWVVQDKQGTTYYFEHVSSYPYETGRCPDPSAGYEYKGYRWSLSRVRNIFNQEIQYTYDISQTKRMYVHQYYNGNQECLTGIPIDPITATYPKHIIYANGKYRVKFDKGSSPNRLDYQSAWDGPGEFNAYEKYRLQNIYIEQDADGDGEFETVLRRYQFTYKADTDSDIIFPGYIWSAGGKTTTLKAVQEFGVGGTTSLPATTFSYGDNLHLTRVDNGYGGAVEFTYGRWYDATNARKSYTVEQQFGQPSYPCRIDDWQPWTALYGEMNCGDGSRDPLHIWGAHGMGIAYDFYNASYSVYGVNHSKDLIRPGGVYKLSTNVNWQPGMSIQVGVFDGIRFQLFYVSTSSNTNIISLPVDAYLAQVVIDETGGSGIGNNHPAPATVSYLKLELLPSIYRVTQKKVYKSPSDQSPYTYSYDYSKAGVDSAAFNDGVIAPASTCDPSMPSASCFEFFQRYSEFRGHAQVTETGPDGRQTITQYYQDDLLKGRPSSITTTDGVKTVTAAIYTYDYMAALSLWPYRPCNGCSGFLGLSRNWIYATAVENRIYLNDGTNYHRTRTLYEYQPLNGASPYGNLILQTEQLWNGSAWVDYRKTQTDYFFNNNGSVYLVGLPARQQIKDSANTVIAEALNIYDSNTLYSQAPTVGKLTAVRTWMGGTQYSQTTFGYDAWGNKTSVTTYTGYGTASAAPTTVGQKTYICYGSDPSVMGDELLGEVECTGSSFHNFPLWTKNALGHQTIYTYDYGLGVPLSETDPNGSVTRAEYDPFGRIVKLIRPGDDSASPTISITYPSTNPFTFPFTTTLVQKIDSNTAYTVRREYDGIGRQTKIVSGGTITETIYTSATETWQRVPYTTGTPPNQYTKTVVNPTARSVTVTAPDTTYTITTTNGLTTTFRDARANITTTTNDVWGRVVSVAAPTGPTVTYTYDEMNRLKTATRGGVTTALNYDNAGRKKNMTDPDMGYWQYGYDALGNLTSQIDARNCVLTLGYDSLSRLVSKTSSGADCGTQVTASYTYDVGINGLGFRTGMTDASGSTVWVYDARGRMVNESKTIDGQTFITRWGYNSADLATTTTYPDGEIVTSTYNERMLLDKLTGTDSYVQSTTYDSAGRMDVRTFGNTTQTDYDYYSWDMQGGRLHYLKSGTIGAPASLQNLNYAYDAAGNVSNITNILANEINTYDYDPLNRLTSWNLNGTPEYYTYNAAGNLDVKAGVDLNYTDTNHVHAVTDIAAAQKYWYDQNGNQITRKVGADTYNLLYDAENKVTQVKKNSVSIATFVYDGDGRRVKSVINGVTKRYVNALYETEGDPQALNPSVSFQPNTPALPNVAFNTNENWVQSKTFPGTSIWRTTWGGTALPRTGTNAYAISNQAYGWLNSDAITVTPGSQYTASVWARGQIDPDDIYGGWIARMYFYDSSGQYISTQDFGSGATLSTTWTQKSNTITPPANTATMRVFLFNYLASGWVAYDDVSVVKVGTSTNLITNAGFETGSNWTTNSEPNFPATTLWRSTWGTATPHTGSYAYVITNQAYATLASTPISVTPGSQYDVAAWVRGKLDGDTTYSGAGWLLYVNYYNASGQLLSSVSAVASSDPNSISETWSQKTGRITAPANAATMILYPHFYLASGWVAYDDMSVIKVGTSTNLVSNPGFENGTGWTTGITFPNTSVWRSTWGTAMPHSGSYAYVISNQAYGAVSHAAIPVTANNQYDVSAWVRGKLDGDTTFSAAGWLLYAQFYNASGQFVSASSVIGSSNPNSISETWAQKSGRITVPVGAASMIVFPHFYFASGWVTYDDVAVVKVGTSNNLVPNPDFLQLTYNQQLSNSIPVTANVTYSLSALVHGNGATATGNWAVRLHYYDSAGNILTPVTDVGSSYSNSTTTTGQTTGGQFTAPTNAASIKIALSSALTSGTLTIENVALSQAPTATKYYFAGAQRVAMRTGSTLSYLLSDHLGSTSITTNSSGALVSELRYKPWGEVRLPANGQNPGPSKYTFTGQYSYATDFGLMFYNARFYDPALGRFTSADTIIPGGVQGLDRYAYANNSPIMYIDPSGHLPKDEWLRLYGEKGWWDLTKNLSKDMIDFLLSDAFNYGNIAVLQLDNGKTANLIIGENADGNGIAFYDVDNKYVYSGDQVFEAINRTVKWGAMQRKTDPESPNDYFGGGYEVASSNSCPGCDESIVFPEWLPQDNGENPNFPGLISGNDGYIYIKNQINTPLSVKGMAEYYTGLFSIAGSCGSGKIGACVGSILTGGFLIQDAIDDLTDAVIDQRPLIVDWSP